ncbi:MAG TPA: trypsin-like peptidase domain-containing protein [Bryobacteraceae bacterium]|nr:trypsin-like peptidase domain-containing protein [Bryobacteraceae bacterium]
MKNRFWNSSLRGSLLALVSGLLILPASGAQRLTASNGAAETMHNLQLMSSEMERLSIAVAPKVVQIATQGLKITGNGDEQPAGVLVAERGRGSGFFVSSDGYLLTNAHVIADAIRITVVVQSGVASPDADRTREYVARVAGVDNDNDLALLKIDAEGLSFFDLNRGVSARQGQLVLAYGNPMGLSQSATLGLVSAVERQLIPDDPRVYIQTDAPLNPGNSGGPLVDLDGHLLGVNTMILSQSGGSEGIGFAVPLDVARYSYSILREKGTMARPMLGVQPRSLTPELIAGLHLKATEGVLVEDVPPGGPGADAGLQPGDVISGLAGKPIRNVRDLLRVEYQLSPGQASELTVLRGDSPRALRITPAVPRSSPAALPSRDITDKDNLILRLSMYGATLTPTLASGLDAGAGFHRRAGDCPCLAGTVGAKPSSTR